MRRILILSIATTIALLAAAERGETHGIGKYRGDTLTERLAYLERANAHAHKKMKTHRRYHDRIEPRLLDARANMAKLVAARQAAQVPEEVASPSAPSAAPESAVTDSASSGSYGGSFDDGSYNCGLQFADGWMDEYNIVCGDPESQINAAEDIAQNSSGDPWPNCPDPYDGSGASWDDTVACENGGRW